MTGLHHVAFAHREDDTPNGLADLLGLSCATEEQAEGFVERMMPVGVSYVQLLQGTGPGVIERFLARRGPGLHHIAFEVSDLDEAVADLLARGVRMVDRTPRPGAHGTRIAFIHPAALGGLLVELVAPDRAAIRGGADETVGRL